MNFDAADFLKSLFGGTPQAAVSDVSVDGPRVVLIPEVGDGEAGGAAAIPEAVALLVWIEPEEDVILPPCPTCGDSDFWETILGEWRCQHCDAPARERSGRLREDAARLRRRSPRLRRTADIFFGRCLGPVEPSGLQEASSGL
jgi:hypothetical protein